jgi:hypothetical protein
MSGEVAVNPATGEVLERLDEQSGEILAEALHVVHERQAELAQWRDALEGELRRRLKIRQAKLAVFGEWEVQTAGSRESVWDVDELEQALQALVDDGVIQAGDVADVITRKPVVSRSAAKRLLSRLAGPARERIAAACTWREKPGKVTVVRSVALPAPPGAGEDSQPSPAPPADLNPEELFA